ncbi:MAG: NAD(P)-dependent oxidoreductase [Usitatibacteraceae bacterium]
MRILLTGSSGPKVAAQVVAILSRQHEIIGVDLTPAATTSIVADITQIKDWQPQLRGVDAVIHFAALHAPHRETHSAAEFRRTNVDSTRQLLDAAREAGVKRFLLASSTSVYGKAMRSKTSAVWVTEALTPEAEDIYDETKLAAEALCRDAFSASFVTAALRFSRSFPEPLPLMALYRLYRGVDARDVAQAFGESLTASFSQFEAINISGDTPFLRSDCDVLGADAPAVLRLRAPEFVEEFARRQWDLPARIDRVYVIEKAKALLNYQPRFGFRELLAEQG